MPLTSTRNQLRKNTRSKGRKHRVVEVPVEAELVDDVVAGKTFAQELRDCADPLGEFVGRLALGQRGAASAVLIDLVHHGGDLLDRGATVGSVNSDGCLRAASAR